VEATRQDLLHPCINGVPKKMSSKVLRVLLVLFDRFIAEWFQIAETVIITNPVQ